MKMKIYDNRILKDVTISYKIDGVQLKVKEGKYQSRAGKELFNLPPGLSDGTYEIFLGSWNRTITACRSKGLSTIPIDCLYNLKPEIDRRLIVGNYPIVTSDIAQKLLLDALKRGYEGIVIRTATEEFKLKEKVTHETLIIGKLEGTGRNKGRLGALVTMHGQVGTGFTDQERIDLWAMDLTDMCVEVEAMSISRDGKFRHPRFIRLRPDKQLTIFDQ
jgi:hypothetical protein